MEPRVKFISYDGKYPTLCSGILTVEIEGKIIAQEIVESNFCAVGRKYGVSDNTIRKWCVNYGIPKTKKELEEWLSKQ